MNEILITDRLDVGVAEEVTVLLASERSEEDTFKCK